MNTTLTKAAGRGSDRRRHVARAAFTLIELMVVMAIIIVLAGMSIRFMSGSTETANRKVARTQIEAMELALDMYNNEHGEYPISEVDENDDEGAGAQVLYMALSGDGENEGRLGSTHKPFMTDLDPEADSQNMVAKQDAKYLLVDPWGAPWKYRRWKTAAGRQVQWNTATFDLWSEGGEAKASSSTGEKNKARWIKNW